MRVAIYSRVSKESSDNTNQLLVLREYCLNMNYEIYYEYLDVISGAKEFKPEFEKMLKDASQRKFDMLLFFSLDRLTREGTRKTIYYLQLLDDYKVTYKSYTEQYIDSSGIFKDVIIALLSTLAKQERIRISERVKAALAKSRLQGRIGGRPAINVKKINEIKELKSSGMSIVNIAQKTGVSRGTIYQYLS